MIKYKEVIGRGFKRIELGNDSVWYDNHGYNWFLCEKVLAKLKGDEQIIANWCPEDMAIELLRIKKSTGDILFKLVFDDINEFDIHTQIFNR